MQDTLAQKLRVLRAERGLTLREAEQLTGVDKDTLSKLERGLRHPYDVTLSKLARGYDVPVEELLEEPVPLGEAPAKPERGPKVVRGAAHIEVDAETFKILEALADGEISVAEAKERLDRVLEPILQ
jgi:transcriptional regulator with XRE-family HTH domain